MGEHEAPTHPAQPPDPFPWLATERQQHASTRLRSILLLEIIKKCYFLQRIDAVVPFGENSAEFGSAGSLRGGLQLNWVCAADCTFLINFLNL